MTRTSTIEAVAFTRSGRPVWPLTGAEGDDGDGGDGGGDGGDDGDGDGDGKPDDGLTDAGRQAIERERNRAKTSAERVKPWNAIARDFGLTPEQVRERLTGKPSGDGDKDKVDVEAVKRQATADANAKANAKIVKAEVRARATGSFIDPADALLFVDISTIEVDDDGDVDADAIDDALKKILKSKPHLAKQGKAGSYDGGARKTADRPQTMNNIIHNAVARKKGVSR